MRRIGSIVAAIAIALAVGSCFQSESETCASGGGCPEGYKCTASGDGCIDSSSRCGDGRLDTEVGETCDDGNADDTDNCVNNCTSDGRCGNSLIDSSKGEVCDNGPYNGGDNPDGGGKCSLDCKSRLGCGNGITDTNEGEDCDDGDGGIPIDTARCTRMCTRSICGDNYINDAGGEICDDESTDWRECPYGMGTCQACDNRTCARYEPLTGPTCGDDAEQFFPDGGKEVCDDGNVVNESVCDVYGGSCDSCNSTCTAPIILFGPSCGDGLINGPSDGGSLETCDDGNASACGTCNASCSLVQNEHATGWLTAVATADLKDTGGEHDTFTLNDGANGGNTPLTFEFDTKVDGVSDSSHYLIDANCGDPLPDGGPGLADCPLETVAQRMAILINSLVLAQNFKISAFVDGGTVHLYNLQPGVIGNRAITESVHDSAFTKDGMSGGTGGDCTVDTGCITDADCRPPLTCQSWDAGLRLCR